MQDASSTEGQPPPTDVAPTSDDDFINDDDNSNNSDYENEMNPNDKLAFDEEAQQALIDAEILMCGDDEEEQQDDDFGAADDQDQQQDQFLMNRTNDDNRENNADDDDDNDDDDDDNNNVDKSASIARSGSAHSDDDDVALGGGADDSAAASPTAADSTAGGGAAASAAATGDAEPRRAATRDELDDLELVRFVVASELAKNHADAAGAPGLPREELEQRVCASVSTFTEGRLDDAAARAHFNALVAEGVVVQCVDLGGHLVPGEPPAIEERQRRVAALAEEREALAERRRRDDQARGYLPRALLPASTDLSRSTHYMNIEGVAVRLCDLLINNVFASSRFNPAGARWCRRCSPIISGRMECSFAHLRCSSRDAPAPGYRGRIAVVDGQLRLDVAPDFSDVGGTAGPFEGVEPPAGREAVRRDLQPLPPWLSSRRTLYTLSISSLPCDFAPGTTTAPRDVPCDGLWTLNPWRRRPRLPSAIARKLPEPAQQQQQQQQRAVDAFFDELEQMSAPGRSRPTTAPVIKRLLLPEPYCSALPPVAGERSATLEQLRRDIVARSSAGKLLLSTSAVLDAWCREYSLPSREVAEPYLHQLAADGAVVLLSAVGSQYVFVTAREDALKPASLMREPAAVASNSAVSKLAFAADLRRVLAGTCSRSRAKILHDLEVIGWVHKATREALFRSVTASTGRPLLVSDDDGRHFSLAKGDGGGDATISTVNLERRNMDGAATDEADPAVVDCLHRHRLHPVGDAIIRCIIGKRSEQPHLLRADLIRSMRHKAPSVSRQDVDDILRQMIYDGLLEQRRAEPSARSINDPTAYALSNAARLAMSAVSRRLATAPPASRPAHDLRQHSQQQQQVPPQGGSGGIAAPAGWAVIASGAPVPELGARGGGGGGGGPPPAAQRPSHAPPSGGSGRGAVAAPAGWAAITSGAAVPELRGRAGGGASSGSSAVAAGPPGDADAVASSLSASELKLVQDILTACKVNKRAVNVGASVPRQSLGTLLKNYYRWGLREAFDTLEQLERRRVVRLRGTSRSMEVVFLIDLDTFNFDRAAAAAAAASPSSSSSAPTAADLDAAVRRLSGPAERLLRDLRNILPSSADHSLSTERKLSHVSNRLAKSFGWGDRFDRQTALGELLDRGVLREVLGVEANSNLKGGDARFLFFEVPRDSGRGGGDGGRGGGGGAGSPPHAARSRARSVDDYAAHRSSSAVDGGAHRYPQYHEAPRSWVGWRPPGMTSPISFPPPLLVFNKSVVARPPNMSLRFPPPMVRL